MGTDTDNIRPARAGDMSLTADPAAHMELFLALWGNAWSKARNGEQYLFGLSDRLAAKRILRHADIQGDIDKALQAAAYYLAQQLYEEQGHPLSELAEYINYFLMKVAQQRARHHEVRFICSIVPSLSDLAAALAAVENELQGRAHQ